MTWFSILVVAVAVKIRPAQVDDASGIAMMLRQSVESLASPHYSTKQIEAWCDLLPSKDRMKDMLKEPDRQSWVAIPIPIQTAADETPIRIAGYIDWKPRDRELDLLYVHPCFARQGVASQLFHKIICEALLEHSVSETKHSGLLLRTRASEGARPFFEKYRFQVVQRREFAIGSEQIQIHNFQMELKKQDYGSVNYGQDCTKRSIQDGQ